MGGPKKPPPCEIGLRGCLPKGLRISLPWWVHLYSRKAVAANISNSKHGERHAVTLRYLATGDSQQTKSFCFRIGRSTVNNIIWETCKGISCALKNDYLKPPTSNEEREAITNDFYNEWNFPNCLGAFYGKHVRIECPQNAGSAYFNFKNFHSMVLLAICDAKYSFILVDIDGYGRDSDAIQFTQSAIGKGIQDGKLNVPGENLADNNLLGDDISSLKTWLMKPLPGKNVSKEMRIYNYRLSRARTTENTFGIYAAKWRIFRHPIRAHPETVERVIKAQYVFTTS